MSTERAYSKIVIGGTLHAEQLAEFLDAHDECGSPDELRRDDVRKAASEAKALVVEGLIPTAVWEELEDFCRYNSLTFYRESDSSRSWDGQTTFWAPDGRHYDELESANGVTVTLFTLESALKKGKTLEQVVADLRKPANCGESDVPPLVIVGDD